MADHLYKQVPLEFIELPPSKMQQRADEFFELMKRRRSIRAFSDRPVDRKVIEQCLLTAGRAPVEPISNPGNLWW